MLMGAICGLIGALIGMGILYMGASKVRPGVETTLRNSQSAMTVPEVVAAMGMSGGWAINKVNMAMGQLAKANVVEALPAPEGTPRRQLVQTIRYQVRGQATLAA